MLDGHGSCEVAGVYSCVGNVGNTWVLLKAVGLLGMCVQNTQHGYIVDKPPRRVCSENICSS